MWGKKDRRILDLLFDNGNLRYRLKKTEEELKEVENKLEDLQRNKKNVHVYLNNSNTIMVYDAIRYELSSDSPFVVIYNESGEVVANIIKEDIAAISIKPLLMEEEHVFHPSDYPRRWKELNQAKAKFAQEQRDVEGD